MQQQMPFPLSESYRTYTPRFVSNLLMLSAFLGGVAGLALFLVPRITHENLPRDVYFYSGGILLLFWLFTILMFWLGDLWGNWQKRRAIRKILEEKNLLAAWQYTPSEWQGLAEMQSNAEARAGYQTWHTLSMLPFGGLALAYMAYAMPAEVRISIVPIGIFLVAMILLNAILNRIKRQNVLAQNRARRAENPTPTLYLSRKGIYHETEGILEFNGIEGLHLEQVGNFPQLSFTTWVKTGRGSWFAPIFIPIPQQHVADARQIAAQLKDKG